MRLLEGKVAIVTGAGGGLGRSHALTLAAHGAKVVVNDPGVARDGSGGGTKMADTVVNEIKNAGGDAVANYDSVATTEGAENIIKTAVEAYGKVDILINNAGILRDKTLLNTTDDMWDLVMDVHMRGTFACTRAAAKIMREKGTGGRIINTTSVAGLKGNFGQANYSSAKAGIYGFTLTTAMELAKDKITVNAIAPLAKTRMTADIDSIPDDWKPEDVSNLICYLVSDKAADVNGRIIGVHGKHLFEYKMSLTDGKQNTKEWTFDEINEWIHTPEVKAEEKKFEASSDIKRLFDVLAQGFTAERAEGWESVIHFAVAPAGDWTATIKDKTCTVTPGKPANAKTVLAVDGKTLLGVINGSINPNMAFLTGKMKTSNMQDLVKFSKVFHFKKIAALMKGEAVDTKQPEAQPASLNKLIGKKFYGSAIVVHPDKISLYDTTVGDNGSPIFPVTLSKELFFKLVKDPDFTADIARLVHGEQAMRFINPIKAWDVVSPRGEVITVEEKPSGQIIVFRQRIYCEGELMVEMDSTLFIRGESAGNKAPKPATSFDGEVFYDTTIPSDLPAKYAVASGDDNLIHTDKSFAQSVGFKDVILHGLGTLALVSNKLPKHMKSLKVRFAKPVYPGDKISGKMKNVDGHVEFIATNDNGDVVLTNGVVE